MRLIDYLAVCLFAVACIAVSSPAFAQPAKAPEELILQPEFYLIGFKSKSVLVRRRYIVNNPSVENVEMAGLRLYIPGGASAIQAAVNSATREVINQKAGYTLAGFIQPGSHEMELRFEIPSVGSSIIYNEKFFHDCKGFDIYVLPKRAHIVSGEVIETGHDPRMGVVRYRTAGGFKKGDHLQLELTRSDSDIVKRNSDSQPVHRIRKMPLARRTMVILTVCLSGLWIVAAEIINRLRGHPGE